MSEEEKKALINLIDKLSQDGLTGNVQLNFFKGTCGTVQFLTSYKLDSLVEKFFR